MHTSWMSQIPTELQAMRTLNLVRYAWPGQFVQFENAPLERSTKSFITVVL